MAFFEALSSTCHSALALAKILWLSLRLLPLKKRAVVYGVLS
jgi:hypothetical protein